MAVAPMTPETLEKLTQEGVAQTAPVVTPEGLPGGDPTVPAKETQDIEFIPPGTAQTGPDVGTAPKVEPPADATPGPVFDAFIDKKITAGGFKVDDVKARIIKDGGVTPEFAAELKKSIDPDLVDTYIEGLAAAKKAAPTVDPNIAAEAAQKAATVKKFNDYIYDSVGGKEKFAVLSSTLKAGLPQEAVDVLNAKLSSQNEALVSEGMKEAVNHYKKLTGRINNRMEGTPTGPNVNEEKFMTKAQYYKILGTDKYKTDPAYAKQIDDQRLASRRLDASRTMPGQYFNVHNGELYNL